MADERMIEMNTKTVNLKDQTEVGEPATVVMSGEAFPAEITRVSEKSIWLRQVEVIGNRFQPDGTMDLFVTGDQVGEERRFTLRKTGQLMLSNTPDSLGCYAVLGVCIARVNPNNR